MGEPLGLIAGAGELPAAMARSARQRGREPVVVAVRGAAEPAQVDALGHVRWLGLGELQALLDHFRSRGVREAVMGGKVDKRLLVRDPASLRPDARAQALLASLADRGDDSILGAIADTLAAEGVTLVAQADWVPELVPGAGALGAVEPSEEQWADVRFAWPIARSVAGLDVGQCVVVKGRAVLAVEAIEGTDAAIRRAGGLGGGGSVVVKLARPRQDPRFDLPALGPATIRAMVEAGAGALAFEAGTSLMLERETLVREADAAGIAVWGVPAGGPEPRRGPA